MKQLNDQSTSIAKYHLLLLMLFLAFNIDAQDRILPLSLGWEFRKANSSDEWLMATIPGTVHTDLYNNGKIPDPFSGCNNTNLGWIDDTSWEYLLKLKLDKDLFKNKHVELVFEGLDTYAEVYLNDTLVLNADNMFRKWVVSCDKLLKQGENRIKVVFKSAVNEVSRKSKELPYTLPGGEWAWVRKSPYHFGWDWGPRFVTCGIWKPVYLQSWRDITIKDIQVKTDSIYRDKAFLTANISIASARFQHINIKVLDGDKVYGKMKARVGSGSNRI